MYEFYHENHSTLKEEGENQPCISILTHCGKMLNFLLHALLINYPGNPIRVTVEHTLMLRLLRYFTLSIGLFLEKNIVIFDRNVVKLVVGMNI